MKGGEGIVWNYNAEERSAGGGDPSLGFSKKLKKKRCGVDGDDRSFKKKKDKDV
jgi:hypothetical protein